jgi:hypothetical protein
MKSRYTYFPPFATAGELTPTEEEASSWLWHSPRLLDWPRNISWLGSRVHARKSAARLWGVDSTGSLIIVEIKIDRGEAPDPFESLVFDVKRRSTNREWTAESLRREWRKWYTSDRSDPHQRRVERSLNRRNDVGNPHPVFFGVVASIRSKFRLSQKATKNLEQLQKRLGDERVLLRVMSATLDAGKLRVQCKAPEGSESGCAVTS